MLIHDAEGKPERPENHNYRKYIIGILAGLSALAGYGIAVDVTAKHTGIRVPEGLKVAPYYSRDSIGFEGPGNLVNKVDCGREIFKLLYPDSNHPRNVTENTGPGRAAVECVFDNAANTQIDYFEVPAD
jgi:hypothetical protein